MHDELKAKDKYVDITAQHLLSSKVASTWYSLATKLE